MSVARGIRAGPGPDRVSAAWKVSIDGHACRCDRGSTGTRPCLPGMALIGRHPTSSRRSEVFRVRYLIAAGGAALLAAALAPLAHAAPEPAPKPAAKYDWPQFALDAGKSANDTAESTVTLANVKNLKQLFKVALPDAPDGSPVYLHDVTTPMGVKDVVYVQGEHGHLMAFDGHSGAKIWSDSFGPGGISNSSPAVEPSRKFIYINANDAKVHKVQVGDGKEVKAGGWPVSTGGGKSSSALTIATARNGHTYLYASNQGNGRVTTIDLADASKHIFSLACSNHPDSA